MSELPPEAFRRAPPHGPARCDGRRAADRRRILGHLADRSSVRADLRQTRVGETARRGGLAGAGRAQCLRGTLDASRGRVSRRDCSGRMKQAALWRWSFFHPKDHPLWKNQLRDGIADADFAASVAKALVTIHAKTAADPSIAAEFPTDAIFYDIRLEPYLVATARVHPDRADRLLASGGRDTGEQESVGAWRCQPEEHSSRTLRTGVPGRRMCVVGRSGVRSGVLPQSSAVEVPVDAARARRVPALFRCVDRRVFARRDRGKRRTRWSNARRRCCPACSWRESTANRRSNTSPPKSQKDQVRRVARALLADPPHRLSEIS